VLLSACGGDDSGGPASGPAPLVATTSIWADITSHVACGEDVKSIVPPGTDPHSFEPSLRDREILQHAGAVIANGSGLEGGLTGLVDAAAGDGVPVVEITDHVQVVDGDPHVWQDPRRVLTAVDAIEQAVVGAGRDPATIHACAGAYRAELATLDSDVAAKLAV